MTESRHLDIRVPVLARVEGEGALDLDISGDDIERVHLRIYEPPRLFEKLLEGRSYTEVPDIVARICGICPVAYQMSAVQALEQAFAIEVTPAIRQWRRLFYCGEWIQSHSLHIHMLAAPDFLGFDSIIAMGKEYPDEVRRGLRLQALGNHIMRLLGARSVHPVGACVGGFYKLPERSECLDLRQALQDASLDALALVKWVGTIDVPDDEQEFTSAALRHPAEYPIYDGRLVSDSGLDIAIGDFTDHIVESQVPWSTALHAHLDGQPYLVGPLARLNLNMDRLPDSILQAVDQAGIRFPSRNMFHSLFARAVEILFAVGEAGRILDEHPARNPASVAVEPVAGVGVGCTEAPRGVLWHRYETDENGNILSARIVPPTSQNQARIEQDLRTALYHFGVHRKEQDLRHHAETVIRNYDPCISCATHFLNLRVHRQP